ncbi:cytochrome b/b6 domain-containing protein [Mesorhizobium sp. 1B3]|uniref:cytochrome b/b6 domain-containing protein n=1 Tax=Mesorhizobium sp. 1B3 TaxID=3243599 RepID=UPI003D982E62
MEKRTSRPIGPLVYRQSVWTRATHWTWAVCLFFLLVSALQIFNAHPALYVGQESGFEYENFLLAIYAEETPEGLRGRAAVFDRVFDTTGVLGVSNGEPRGFPAWATLPSYQDLATGRLVHFFFGWIFVATLFVWFVNALAGGRLRRGLLPTCADIRRLPRDILDHARGRFHHGRSYGVLQKVTYAGVLFVLFPLIVLSGLTMSPGMVAAWPWLLDLFGGRQTARSVHFLVMLLLVAFFIVHILMVLLAGPLNELRSMTTGWYRADPGTPPADGDRS